MDLLSAISKPACIEPPHDWRDVAQCLVGECSHSDSIQIKASALPVNFVGPARKMPVDGYLRAAVALGVPEAAVRAVAAVEAVGSGFLKSGRPKILFEAHVFSRLTGHKYDASHPGISSTKWNRSLYGAAGDHQYERLAEAMKLNEDAALQACSWGAFQIMGPNFKRCGFTSVQTYVYDVLQGEYEQLMHFVAFVQSDEALLRALRKRKWSDFARLYNGPLYEANRYDVKLANEYIKAGGR